MMEKVKEIMYERMYKIEVNGFALMSIVTLFLYGLVSLIVDFINLF